MLAFFSDLFHKDALAPNTILSYKNALAYPLQLAFGIALLDKEFTLMSRAHFLARPKTSRVFPQWDINRVIPLLLSESYTYGRGIVENIISKTLFIIALASGNRVSEIAAYYRPGILFGPNDSSVVIPVRPGFLFKNQRLKRAPPNLELTALVEEGFSHPLCPVRAVRHALAVAPDTESTALFTSEAGRPLSKASIAMRLTLLIERANPGAVPRAHDVRKMAASLAWVRGVNPQEIIRRGFWSSYNTFLERYLVPVIPTQNQINALGTV